MPDTCSKQTVCRLPCIPHNHLTECRNNHSAGMWWSATFMTNNLGAIGFELGGAGGLDLKVFEDASCRINNLLRLRSMYMQNHLNRTCQSLLSLYVRFSHMLTLQLCNHLHVVDRHASSYRDNRVINSNTKQVIDTHSIRKTLAACRCTIFISMSASSSFISQTRATCGRVVSPLFQQSTKSTPTPNHHRTKS
jgi:hypothetical protein